MPLSFYMHLYYLLKIIFFTHYILISFPSPNSSHILANTSLIIASQIGMGTCVQVPPQHWDPVWLESVRATVQAASLSEFTCASVVLYLEQALSFIHLSFSGCHYLPTSFSTQLPEPRRKGFDEDIRLRTEYSKQLLPCMFSL